LSEAELVECIDLQTQLDSMYMTEGSFIRWRKILQSTTHFFRIEHNNSRNATINSLNRLSTVLSFLILRKLAHFVQTSIVIFKSLNIARTLTWKQKTSVSSISR